MYNYNYDEMPEMTGFHKLEIEKVCRISTMLEKMMDVLFLKERLSLIGGTAINFIYTKPLARLSVDLDFNYTKPCLFFVTFCHRVHREHRDGSNFPSVSSVLSVARISLARGHTYFVIMILCGHLQF